MTDVFVGLGSNIDAEHNIVRAVAALQRHYSLTCSPAYRTPAEGFAGQDFINLVVRFDCDESLAQLLARLKTLELQLGKDLSQPRFAAKRIDLDLLFFGRQIIRHDRVSIPPADLRPYYLKPLADLVPDCPIPGLEKTCLAVWQEHEAGHEFSPVNLSFAADAAVVGVQLLLDDLRIAVHLGVTAAEREAPQEVMLALQLQFASAPGACNNDSIDATVDYAVLCASLTRLLQAQAWQTIEYMAHCALRHVVGLVSQQPGIDVAEVELAVRKFPQVPGLDGGAQVRLCQCLEQRS